MKAKLFSLAKNDFVKGLMMAVIGAVLGALYPWVEAWVNSTPMAGVTFKMQLWAALKLGVGAAIAYLSKNFFSNSAGQPLTSEKKAADKKSEMIQDLRKQVS